MIAPYVIGQRWLSALCWCVAGCLSNACVSPVATDGWEVQAKQHLQRGEFAAARKILEQQRENGNRSVVVYQLLDRACADTDLATQRLAYADEGLYWYPQNLDLMFARVYALTDLQRFAQAREMLEDLSPQAREPAKVRLRILLAQMEISSREGDDVEFARLLAIAEAQAPGITQLLEEQRVRNARPAANLPAATIEPWLSSHPTWERRIQEIKKQQENGHANQ